MYVNTDMVSRLDLGIVHFTRIVVNVNSSFLFCCKLFLISRCSMLFVVEQL